jgi:rubrerythrin
VIKLRRYLCLECGNNVDLKGVYICPICNNKDKTKLLQNIDIEVSREFVDNKTSYNKVNKEVLDKINHFVKTRCHSSAYLKVCACDLKELGEFELARELEDVAIKKLEVETKLLEMLGTSSDIRLNMSNLIAKALEDVKLAREIENYAKNNNNVEIAKLLSAILIDESTNLFILNVISNKIVEKNISIKE